MRKKLAIAVVLLGLLVAVAAGASSARPTSAKLTTLNVGVFPSLDYAPLFGGLKLGIFKKHGLDLKITYIYTGSGLTAALTSGQVQLATNSVTAGVNGIINGLPIKMVTATDIQATKGNTEVLVKKDSPIKNFGDLAGKTVATINLQGLFQLGTMLAIKAAGGDPNSLHALPMAATDEPNALAAGRLDAIVLQDPFLTQAKAAHPDFRSLGNPFSKVPFKILAGAFYATNSQIQKDPKNLLAFRAAWKEAAAAATTHPKFIRSIIPKYTGIDPDLVGKITPPDYTSGVPSGFLGPMLKAVKSFGWISGTVPNYNAIVWNGK